MTRTARFTGSIPGLGVSSPHAPPPSVALLAVFAWPAAPPLASRSRTRRRARRSACRAGSCAAGDGPFPAVVLLHGCHGVSASTRAWARWFRERGYVALIVDSWRAWDRGGCDAKTPDLPSTERFDDTGGAALPSARSGFVDRSRIGVMGCRTAVVFSIAAGERS